MFKKAFLIILSCVLVSSFSSCSKTQTEDSVIVKDSENLSEYRLKETTLLKPVEFENEGLRVTLENILYEDLYTWFSFDVKNETDKAYKVLITDLSVNGIMYQGTKEEDADAKISKKFYFEISNDWFLTSLIETIKELEFTVRILDESSTEISTSDVLKAVTDTPKKYVQKYDNKGLTIYENDGVVILYKGLTNSKFSDDSELGFFIENNKDTHFSVLADEVYVNDKLFTPAFIVSVGANKKASESMLFTKEELKNANINNITSVKVSFKAIDKNSNIVFKTELIDIPIK